jgi:transposase-like protein
MKVSDSRLFKGRHFDQQVIILCVRWYLGYKLSSRDLVEMMGERGIELAHTTILRWVQRYVPEFERRWSRYARTVGGSWRCDETYIKVNGRWTYLYRAVDKQGRNSRFPAERATRRCCCESILPEGHEAQWNASHHHP